MTAISACRSCGNAGLQMVFSLGAMPLANALLSPEELHQPEPRYPLDLVFCGHCTLVQITETVPPEQLFGHYLYFSSYSDTMVQHARDLAARLIESRDLNAGSLVVELGSNDGYLLQHFVARAIPVLGIEPARNVARVASERGIPTLPRFFGEQLAQDFKTQGRSADVIIANNVLAHVADLNGVVRGVGALLKDHGVAVIEVPYVKDILDRYEFDTIYHEHLCYFSLTALQRLFERHAMMLADVERISIHGGSLRLFVAPRGSVGASDAVERLLQEEQAWGVGRLESYADLGVRAGRVRQMLRSLLESLKGEGMRLAAYGAAAKGTVLLNYCGIDNGLLDFVVDRSPHKQGRYVPGVRIPIYAPARLLEEMPTYTLLLAWNVADEILEQQAEYRRRGGHFIVPIPHVAVV
ncbi:MAG: methyltransferase domain-containing protein [Armatimonadota bacterium]